MERYIKDNEVKYLNEIIITIDNSQIFNPSEELLKENGWTPYVPPVPTPVIKDIPKEDQYKSRIIELIRVKYSIDDEIAILRQREEKHDEFVDYNEFVENCKRMAHNEIYGE